MRKLKPQRGTFFPDDEPKEREPKIAEHSLRQLRRHDEPRPKRRREFVPYWREDRDRD